MSTPWHTPFYFPPIPTHPQPSTYETTLGAVAAGFIAHTDVTAILNRPRWDFAGADVRAWLAMQDAGWTENAEGVFVAPKPKPKRQYRAGTKAVR